MSLCWSPFWNETILCENSVKRIYIKIVSFDEMSPEQTSWRRFWQTVFRLSVAVKRNELVCFSRTKGSVHSGRISKWSNIKNRCFQALNKERQIWLLPCQSDKIIWLLGKIWIRSLWQDIVRIKFTIYQVIK
jgi:hypothetical protein